jgi:hypothetical protein
MRVLKITLSALVMLAMAAVGAAGDMTLTRAGNLYRIAPTDDGLVITGTLADGTAVVLTVPQTAGTATSARSLAVDPVSGALFVIWQQGEGTSAEVLFASYVGQSWTGPVVLAESAASHPQMMLFRAVDVVNVEGDDGQITQVEVATSFLHIAWWSYDESVNDGAAVYLPAPIDDATGLADLTAYDPVVLSDLLPYGLPCDGIEDASALAAPKLFSDPQSGFPHLFATDFAECLFYVLQIGHDVIVDPVTERRRHTIILREGGTYVVAEELPLATASVEVGHGLSLVLHWDTVTDTGTSVDYLQFDPNGLHEVQSLSLGESLNHEHAVQLIRGLLR